MLRRNPLCFNWHLLLVGLLFTIMQCDARAVNVSNTWTMPQEGLNVFYRFFRDRISWFEADAVCQFHHANLVTVDNSFQFDATRDLLRELDVNDIVWIGLMRPQSSDRFMWSNSRPLVADTGYWAESLPLMDAPLCAVIDPIRDYRWHALRCGGPETASFLCEMPVPSWADACNLKDMPNLTLQYMADTASIELIRNCHEEGLLRTMCRGKQDRERALQDLICPRERLEAQRINDITNSHFKSLQIINSIPSDNNENNNIELLPLEVNYGPHYPEELQTEKNTVQKLIEQFNVDELMQADEPSNMETVSSFYKISDLIPKPVKKSAKKVLDYPKKDNGKQKMSAIEQISKDEKRLPLEMGDMMMGDQPLQGEPEINEQLLTEEASNEILEPLPHIKKTNIHKEDGLEKMEKEAIAMKKSMQKSKEVEHKKFFMISTTTKTTTTTSKPTNSFTISSNTDKPTTTEVTSTTTKPLTTQAAVSATQIYEVTRPSEDHSHKNIHKEFDNSGDHLAATTTSATISHPIHPLQPRSNILTEENQHPHTKESHDSSHFIPPMLMVKSHYVPPGSKHGHIEPETHHHYQHNEEATAKQHLEKATAMIKPAVSETSILTTVAATTPKVLDLEKSIFKTLDTLDSVRENEKQISITRKEEELQTAAATTTESDSSIKPITEQPATETEQYKTFKNLHFKKIQATMTTTTLQPVASTAAAIANYEANNETTVKDMEEINKNNNGRGKIEDEIQKVKTTQTTSTDVDEATETTKLVATTENNFKSSEKPYNSETEKETEYASATREAENVRTEQQEQHVILTEKEVAAIKNQDYKEHLQTKVTAQRHDTIEGKTTSTIALEGQTQQASSTITTKEQSLRPYEDEKKVVTSEDKQKRQEDLEESDQDKKQTIAKTTEVHTTSIMASEIPEEAEEVAEAKEQHDTPTTTKLLVQTPSTSETTTTTVKPIITTAPPNEAKSTETSFSSTTTIHTPTTTSTTIKAPTSTNGESSSTTITPTTTTTFLTSSTITATTEAEAESTTTARAEVTSAPETTRNFLKSTTEIPFKPNRRRSLTKPETVSYMKKILG